MNPITYKCLTCGYVTKEPKVDHGYFHFLRCADGPVEQILPKIVDNVQADVKVHHN